MNQWWSEWYNKYAAVSLAVACGYGTYHIYCWNKLTPSDWGTWVGSIFTGLAFCGTIWIATQDARKKREDEIALARITCGALLDTVSRMIHEISIARNAAAEALAAVRTAAQQPVMQIRVTQAIAALEAIPTIRRDELRDLLPVSQAAPMQLAGAVGGTFSSLGLLKAAQRHGGIENYEIVLTSVITRMESNDRLVRAAHEILQQAVFN